jgi:UDP-glucose 4-epimerase
MILVVGGAGYIGSHVNKLLAKNGYKTVVFDSLVKGHREFLKWGEFFEGDLGNKESIEEVFNKYKFEAVFNFAAFIEVGESVVDPQKYYQNNLINNLNLLEAMLRHDVKKYIFSSTAATFGNPLYTPIDEKHIQIPVNAYGQSKLMVEKVLVDYDKAYGLRHIALRYFNACGADLDGEVGEWHSPESHLIPLIFDAVVGKRASMKIFGTDYETKDGTCVRDYIHVNDLADAHIKSLEYLFKNDRSDDFNLGNGLGYSVKEVIEMVKKVTGKDFLVEESNRRGGDSGTLIASSEKAKKVLGWEPKYDLEKIIETAWVWYKKLNDK